MDNIEIEYEYTSRLIPFQETQVKVLQYVSSSRVFGLLSTMFYVFHYMVKRPVGTLFNIISLYLINKIEISISLQMATYTTFMIIGLLKDSLKVPRPKWLYPERFKGHGGLETAYSFPSGHAASLVTLLLMAIQFRNVVTVCLCIAQFILMPISRLYLCVHWVSDVLFSIVLVFIIATVWTFASPIPYIVDTKEHILTYTFIYQFIVLSLYILLIEKYKNKFEEQSDITKKLGIHLKSIHYGTNVGMLCTNMGLYIGLYLNWLYGYVEFPRIYSDFNCLYISVMFYGLTLYLMNGMIYLCRDQIADHKQRIYYIRTVFYFIATSGSMVVPNLLL